MRISTLLFNSSTNWNSGRNKWTTTYGCHRLLRYLIIGLDMDTMAPLGGSDILQMAMDVANNSQNLGYAGWKAFENDRNRFAIINDYLDGAMEPLRQLEYKYHRLGLDRMTENTDTARMAITESMEMLKQARDQKSMSALPVIFTDIKRDELVSIYSGKGTAEEREKYIISCSPSTLHKAIIGKNSENKDMLKSLFIQNYALIDTLDIRFEPGFSVITGETGAGKSIILGAIGLLLGQRADSKSIKNGMSKCIIEAVFDLSAYGMQGFFERNDLEFDGKECIVRREITASGKSRASSTIHPLP